ncbi:methyl-CpG-binding domain-containing protein [Orobanche gracilis]
MQPQSLKLTIKLKPDKSGDKSLTYVDHPTIIQGDQVDLGSTCTEAEGEKYENSQYQLMLYDPNVNGTVETEVQNPTIHRSAKPHPFPNHPSRVLSSVGVFTVQCANCFKWRVIPTKEKYEEIREHIMVQPFVCETGREWRPDMSCDDPPDIKQDESRLWAIDKPSIAQPPSGWERLLRVRGEGSSKFADVYYIAPSGKRLRSMLEVQRYLDQHPEYIVDGVSLSRFSFQTPKPLRENYVRKRPAHAALTNDAGDNGIQGFIIPSKVQPISWVSPDVDTGLQLSGPGLSTDPSKSPSPYPELKSAKRKGYCLD